MFLFNLHDANVKNKEWLENYFIFRSTTTIGIFQHISLSCYCVNYFWIIVFFYGEKDFSQVVGKNNNNSMYIMRQHLYFLFKICIYLVYLDTLLWCCLIAENIALTSVTKIFHLTRKNVIVHHFKVCYLIPSRTKHILNRDEVNVMYYSILFPKIIVFFSCRFSSVTNFFTFYWWLFH